MTTKVFSVSLLYGGLAGIVSALSLLLMVGLQHRIWNLGSSALFAFIVICVGGVLLACLHTQYKNSSLDKLIAESADPNPLHARKIGFIALSAIVAVAFGASIGPEAGLVAIVAELSIFVSTKITTTKQQAQAIGAAGNAAVLSSIYGSPPASAAFDNDSLPPTKFPAFIAGISGFLTFMTTLRIFDAHPHALELPIAPRGEIATWWQAIPAALCGCVVAIIFLILHHYGHMYIAKIASPWLRIIGGSVVLAALLAIVPLLRFSGHAQMPELTTLIEQSAWWSLLALAVLKVIATALSLISGWQGGEFFPLAFAGAAAGAVSLVFLPQADIGTVLVAGMVAATTIALKKPFVIVLIMIFMLPGTAIGPLLVAALIAIGILKILPSALLD
ncbi:putative voltage-gated ClC-type chloride channel ClcB [Corynebacterium kutscheri]|uniref:Voltage-gated ClC-type chloride channel ClcB n=1 Tax=Corynebacterium kutscheri TaxID=35755 RepID=A0AB38VQ01_9CORY|nr:chloride channel protein [Corynebacterium kutscheri]VEH05329.1 putative voltage-gated ClC-type chloride channel ClcB [Corynebacterium kutscheri]VEH80751.1 putative voltage-gated ClC-type chloride channel ClcB [Corynebacterium kutscheri]